jgi:hypothetical protein
VWIGCEPGTSGTGTRALVVVDMLNAYSHPEADRLAGHVGEALPGIRTLRDRAWQAVTEVTAGRIVVSR